MKYDLITKNSDAKLLAKDFLKVKQLPFDSETDCTRDGFDWLNEKQVMWQFRLKSTSYLIDLRQVDSQVFKKVLESPDVRKIIHNSSFDCAWTAREHDIFINCIGDTQLNEIMLLGINMPRRPLKGMKKPEYDALKPKISSALTYCLERRGLPIKLEFIPHYWYQQEIVTKDGPMFLRYYDKKKHGKIFEGPFDNKQLEKWDKEQLSYDARDVEYLNDLYEDQLTKLVKDDMENLLELESKVAQVTYKMMCRGMSIDYMGWLKYAMENEKIYNQALEKLSKFEDLNWQAPGQVSKFFGVSKIQEVRDLNPSTLSKQKAIAWQCWNDANKQYKNVTTYGKTWIRDHIHIDGRVHCQYSQIINTGRYSCDSPNLQQIPAAHKTKHRLFFTTKKNHKLVVADFKSQELAIMAVGSGEPSWLECLREGRDLHAMVASMMFLNWDKLSDKEKKNKRRAAKDINFGIAYGMGAFGFAVKLFITDDPTQEQIEIAADMLKVYKTKFKKLWGWIASNGRFAVHTGKSYSFPPFNRYRDAKALETEEWRWSNIGKNNPVQGTGADMGKLAMIYMDDEDLFIVHFNHDELIVECPESDAERVKEVMSKCMVDACTAILDEPLTTPDIHIVDNWLEAKD